MQEKKTIAQTSVDRGARNGKRVTLIKPVIVFLTKMWIYACPWAQFGKNQFTSQYDFK